MTVLAIENVNFCMYFGKLFLQGMQLLGWINKAQQIKFKRDLK